MSARTFHMNRKESIYLIFQPNIDFMEIKLVVYSSSYERQMLTSVSEIETLRDSLVGGLLR